jgi:hypothetical protein
METISLITEELDALVKRVKAGCLQEGDAEIIQDMVVDRAMSLQG